MYKEHKQTIVLFLICILFFCKNLGQCEDLLLKGGVTSFDSKGQKLQVNLETPVSYYLSLPGDIVSAYINEDVSIGNGKYIPKGSRIEGLINQVKDPKRFGIDGEIIIDFNKIVTPDMITIPMHASVSSHRAPKAERIANRLTYDAALVNFGAINGAIAAAQVGGIGLAISTYGISIGVGAAVGAACGVFGSSYRKGSVPHISSIKPTQILLDSNLYVFGDLPNLADRKEKTSTNEENKEKEFKGFRYTKAIDEDDLEIEIKDVYKLKKDGFGYYIVVDLAIKNHSNKKFSSGYFVLVDKNTGKKIHPDLLLSGENAIKMVEPKSELDTKLSYIIKNPKNYEFAILDLLDNTEVIRKPLITKG